MNPECVWWFLSIWNLVIISDSGPSQGSEGRLEKTLEALSNVFNPETLSCALSWLAVIHPVAFQKSHGSWKEHLCLLSIQSAFQSEPNTCHSCCLLWSWSTEPFAETHWSNSREQAVCGTRQGVCCWILQHFGALAQCVCVSAVSGNDSINRETRLVMKLCCSWSPTGS